VSPVSGAGRDTEHGGARVGMTFTRRPTSVPPDIRPEWRVPLLLIMVDHCRGRVASREQLHVLNSAVLSSGSRSALIAALEGRLAARMPVVQFEPAPDRALDRCTGLGLLQLTTSGRFELTGLGRSVVEALADRNDLFVGERQLLSALPASLSQAAIRNVLRGRRAR
jgi:hypothetical protein